jgi:hypothetical protein
MGTPFDRHIDEEALERYSLARFSETEDYAELEEHLLVCSECQDRVKALDEYAAAARSGLDTLRRDPPSALSDAWAKARGGWGRPLLVTVGAAAGIAAAALVVTKPWDGRGPAVAVLLQAARGGTASGLNSAPAGRTLSLQFDMTELPQAGEYGIEVADAKGAVVWAGTAKPRNGRLAIDEARKLTKGRYWVRIHSGSNRELLREFELAVR